LAVILLEGSRLSSKKIKGKGFVFKYPNLKEALENL
jgi:NAD dependent epimerase/dehydratase family enzyme